MKKKIKLKCLVRFHSANKINCIRGGWGWGNPRVYRASENIRKIYVFLQSNLRVPSLSGNHSSPHLPRMPSNTVLISGPVVGAAQILIWSYSSVFLPSMSTAIRASVFSFVGALSDLFIFHRHRICLVDCVDLICSCTSCRSNRQYQLGRLCVYGIYNRILRAPTKEKALVLIAVNVGGKNT